MTDPPPPPQMNKLGRVGTPPLRLSTRGLPFLRATPLARSARRGGARDHPRRAFSEGCGVSSARLTTARERSTQGLRDPWGNKQPFQAERRLSRGPLPRPR